MANSTISGRICIATGETCTHSRCGIDYACGIMIDPRGRRAAPSPKLRRGRHDKGFAYLRKLIFGLARRNAPVARQNLAVLAAGPGTLEEKLRQARADSSRFFGLHMQEIRDTLVMAEIKRIAAAAKTEAQA